MTKIMANKWWIYQRERFPLIQYIPMMTAFGFCAVSYSAHLEKPDVSLADIGAAAYISAVVSTLCWFMLMRIADEHKDFDEDSKYRPYRPVQRGLVSLLELRRIGVVLCVIQVALALWVDMRLLVLLLLVYGWFALMTAEFFVPKWLKAHLTVYLLSHMVLLPLIDLYATAIEWLPRGGFINVGIIAYMVSSFCDGTVVEVGRKLRAKENEEYGVDTYTQIWGPKKAMMVWLLCITTSYVSTLLEAHLVRVGVEMTVCLTTLYAFAVFIAVRFARNPTPKNAKAFEFLPGIWMFVQYLILGVFTFFK